MKKNQMLFKVFSILNLMGLLLAACSPAATEAPAATDAPAATEAPVAEAVTLTFLSWDDETTRAQIGAVTEKYTELHPNVTFSLETMPGGADGDNIVKTRLATDEMTDLFFYNSGALLQVLHPADTLVDISKEPFMANVVESFVPTVSLDGKSFGVPMGPAMGGGILYNKKVYANLGLSVPKTWAEFEANNEKIKAAGIAPVVATFGDTWTSQLFVLADYYNVEQANPTFAADYTANQAKYATTPQAANGFAYLQEGFEKGWYQKDFATAKLDQGLKMLAEGKAAHYPMLTFALGTIATNYPDAANDIGFFGVPGTDASKSGATIWMPSALYISKTSKNIDAAKDFLAFMTTSDAINTLMAAVPPTGPHMIKGAKLPDNVLPGVKDIAGYIDAGNTAPALEYLSPIKGPALEQICVAIGTGQMDSATAATNYDKDVEKQAQQLGIPGW